MSHLWSRVVCAALLVLGACSARGGSSSGEPSDKPPAAAPRTTRDQVERARPGVDVSPLEIEVPGVDLFALSSKPGKDAPVVYDKEYAPTVVAVAGGVGHPILAGRDVTRAAIAATKDPVVLARVAMAAEGRSGELLLAPKNDDQRQRHVGPPVIEGDTLTFWIWTSGVGRMLEFISVDLTTGALALATPPSVQ
jgi:hypothetical protein